MLVYKPYLEEGQLALLRNTVAQEKKSFAEFTQEFFVKVTPNGKKMDSNNINVVHAFALGIQIIMNHNHSFDFNSLIYHSLFYQNGGDKCGYVLKPPEMYGDISSKFVKNVVQDKFKQVVITVISGCEVRCPKYNEVQTYVEIVYLQPPNNDGEPEMQTFKTESIPNNTINPIWNMECTFNITNPHASFIIFQAVNKINQNLLGWYALPVSCIRQGYRVVPLRDEFFNTIKNSYLFCHIKLVRDL